MIAVLGVFERKIVTDEEFDALWASCEWREEIDRLRQSVEFYKRRCDALQEWQSKMRDPERTIVCDIIANGCTLPPEFAGERYNPPNFEANRGGHDGK